MVISPQLIHLFFSKRVNNDFIHMTLHVDDFFVISSNQLLLDALYDLLVFTYQHIKIKTGDVLQYLGCIVHHNIDGTITVSQPGYVDKLLALTNMQDEAPADTPMTPNQDENNKFSDVDVDKTTYLMHIGLINHLATYTRSDLLHSLSIVAQACSAPSEADFRRVKRIIRYIKGTKDIGLTFSADCTDFALRCYVDASFNCYPDGKGYYGYCFMLGTDTSSFYAKSGKLRIVTLSSTEAEYVAMCFATTEALYLRRLLEDLGYPQQSPTVMFEDNQSCIKMLNSGELNHSTTKHIAPRFHSSRGVHRYCRASRRHFN